MDTSDFIRFQAPMEKDTFKSYAINFNAVGAVFFALYLM